MNNSPLRKNYINTINPSTINHTNSTLKRSQIKIIERVYQ